VGSTVRNQAVTKVALVRCEGYRPERVLRAMRDALGLLGGIERVVRPGQRVLIKPNLLAATPPERAVTTHPAVVGAMVRLVAEAGGEPWVGDSPGGVEWRVTDRALEVSGIGPAARQAGAEVKDFDRGDAQQVECPDGVVLRRFALARAVVGADVVISLAKLKTHAQTLYTGAVKNLLGCLPGGGKIRVHQLAPQSRQLAAALLDIYAVVRPRLALIDGIVAMEGDGPNSGDPRPVGLLIASEDSVAADAAGSHVIGYAPKAIHILRQAEERGLGVGRLSEIEVVGEALDACVARDFARASNLLYELIPRPLARWIGRTVTVEPRIVQGACRRCGLCQRSCPADAVRGDGPFEIDRAACVRCFCCHELCPHGAIELRRSLPIRIYEALHRPHRAPRERTDPDG
jgi:uncharacterized protein (DUF362 family)/Pyruvate/2-oxoacid:ferredoxin oxidoreductase delta subunit